ncbi:MAG TPA: PEP-CTERM sorting domain-containing protein [Candidatus Sulfotelmatobacter sp.]
MGRSTRLIAISSCFLLILCGAALANTCDNFGSFTCPTNPKGKSINAPNVVNLVGTGTTGQSVGILLGSDKFSINVNGHSVVGDELVIVAAFPNGMGGKVDGVSFSPLSSFAEDGAIDLHHHQWTGAIPGTWSGKGIIFTGVSFGYADVGTIGSGPISVTATGVPNGTILYAEIVNPRNGKILFITPNSEGGLLEAPTSTVPEPGSLALMGIGLLALGTQLRRKLGV